MYGDSPYLNMNTQELCNLNDPFVRNCWSHILKFCNNDTMINLLKVNIDFDKIIDAKKLDWAQRHIVQYSALENTNIDILDKYYDNLLPQRDQIRICTDKTDPERIIEIYQLWQCFYGFGSQWSAPKLKIRIKIKGNHIYGKIIPSLDEYIELEDLYIKIFKNKLISS